MKNFLEVDILFSLSPSKINIQCTDLTFYLVHVFKRTEEIMISMQILTAI